MPTRPIGEADNASDIHRAVAEDCAQLFWGPVLTDYCGQLLCVGFFKQGHNASEKICIIDRITLHYCTAPMGVDYSHLVVWRLVLDRARYTELRDRLAHTDRQGKALFPRLTGSSGFEFDDLIKIKISGGEAECVRGGHGETASECGFSGSAPEQGVDEAGEEGIATADGVDYLRGIKVNVAAELFGGGAGRRLRRHRR